MAAGAVVFWDHDGIISEFDHIEYIHFYQLSKEAPWFARFVLYRLIFPLVGIGGPQRGYGASWYQESSPLRNTKCSLLIVQFVLFGDQKGKRKIELATYHIPNPTRHSHVHSFQCNGWISCKNSKFHSARSTSRRGWDLYDEGGIINPSSERGLSNMARSEILLSWDVNGIVEFGVACCAVHPRPRKFAYS